MAERQPSKLNVAGSRPVSRSTPSPADERRRRSLERAAVAVWFELGLGTAAVLLGLLVYIGAPKYSTLGGAPSGPPELLIGGWVGLLVGYAWLLRVFFTNPEPDGPPWRYRAPN